MTTLISYQSIFRDPAAAGRLDGPQWESLVGLAERHGVAAWLYWQTRGGDLPSGLAEALRQSYRREAVHSLLREHHTGQILSALRTAGIPVLVLKGTCLAAAVYPDPALRPMVDVDLLLRRDDLASAVESLAALGYRAPYRFDIADECREHHHLPQLRLPGGLAVELHWTIVRPGGSATLDQGGLDGLWGRARAVVVVGVPVRMLAPEDLLLHCCLHYAWQHRCNGTLRELADVAEVQRRYAAELDWPEIQGRAFEWKVAPAVYLALRLTAEWFGTTPPAGVLEGLRPLHGTDEAIAWAAAKLDTPISHAVNSSIGVFASRPRWRDRLGVFRRRLVLTRTELARMYPEAAASRWIVCYHILRFCALCWRHRGALWSVLRGDPDLLRQARRDDALRSWLGAAVEDTEA
ncbi:MAG: nucleotidyltransferase family protein [Lentisphaeria bacterium]|nr:nucleotidyltransferase family protein [Lentisphaeria bacterium]